MNRKNYLESIIQHYSNKPINLKYDEKINLDIPINSTQRFTDSNTGIVIMPGVTIPMESTYRLISEFSNYNIIATDIRGQGLTKGRLNFKDCTQDWINIGKYMKDKFKVKKIIGIGHSFSALTLLNSDSLTDLYDIKIALAPPGKMEFAAPIKMRSNSTLNNFQILSYKSYRRILSKTPTCEIVNHHNKGLNKIIAMYVDPKSYNDIRNNTPELIDILKNNKKTSHLLFGTNDTRIKFKKENNYYEKLKTKEKYNINIQIFENLDHRFNINKKRLIIGYDNNHLIDYIKKTITNNL